MYGLYQIMYFTLIDILNTLLSPFFIAIFLIIFYQYHKLSKAENVLSIKKPSTLLRSMNSAMFGILGGFISTILFIYLEVSIIPKDFMHILTIAILLSLINPRYMCFAYGGSILSLISLIWGYPRVETKEIMLVVATLHMVESLLILINGYKGKLPAYFEHNGDYVGGYNFNRFWPVPFVIFVGEGLIKPVTLMAILSYSDYTVSYPRRKTIATSTILFFYSSLLMVIIKVFDNPLIAPIFALAGHEFIIYINLNHEKRRVATFTTLLKGVRVLDVSKNGIARELDIVAGDIIISINDIVINDEKDILEIEKIKNSVIKIVYFNNIKGLISKYYTGHKKTLGVSIVPRVMD